MPKPWRARGADRRRTQPPHPSLLDLHERVGANQVRVMPLPSQSIGDDELRVPIVYVSDALAEVLLSGAHTWPQALQAGIDKDLSTHSSRFRTAS